MCLSIFRVSRRRRLAVAEVCLVLTRSPATAFRGRGALLANFGPRDDAEPRVGLPKAQHVRVRKIQARQPQRRRLRDGPVPHGEACHATSAAPVPARQIRHVCWTPKFAPCFRIIREEGKYKRLRNADKFQARVSKIRKALAETSTRPVTFHEEVCLGEEVES